jgi:hypothetical protein
MAGRMALALLETLAQNALSAEEPIASNALGIHPESP